MSELLGAWHLHQARMGDSKYDRELILGLWPDCPLDDLDLVGDWLLTHPDVVAALARIDPHGPPPNGPPLHLLTADDILTTEWPEPVWAIPGLLPAGLTILAGKPKLGKSWLALQIAQSVASGGVVLGEHVERGPVMYLALEDGARRLQDRMRRQNWPLGLDCDFLTVGKFAREVGDLRNGGSEKVAQQIEARGYRLVVIDTLSRAVFGDESDKQAMTRALEPMQEIALDHNCAALLVDHHSSHGFGANPDAVGDILGSTAKGALADCIWGLYRERKKADAQLHVIGRETGEDKSLALWFDGLTGCWQSRGDADELELTERRQQILDALEGLGRASLGTIADIIEQPKSNTHGRLQDLVSAGLVVRVNEGKRVYYEVPEPSKLL